MSQSHSQCAHDPVIDRIMASGDPNVRNFFHATMNEEIGSAIERAIARVEKQFGLRFSDTRVEVSNTSICMRQG